MKRDDMHEELMEAAAKGLRDADFQTEYEGSGDSYIIVRHEETGARVQFRMDWHTLPKSDGDEDEEDED